MILFKKIPTKIEKKDYEIRILYDETTVNVVAFLNSYPANGFRHQIPIPKKFEVKKALKADAVKELVEMSKNDIIEKRWERLLKTLL